MRTSRRIATGALATVAALTLSAGPALAHECINPNKQGDAQYNGVACPGVVNIEQWFEECPLA